MTSAGDGFSWPFQDPQWASKILVQGLITLIPIVGWIATTGWLVLTIDNYRTGRRELPPYGFHLERGIVLFVVYMSVAGTVGFVLAGRTCAKSMQWLVADRPASREEQRRLLLVPLWLALQGMIGWVGAAGAWSLLTASGHHSGSYVARVAMSILLGGLATSGLVYLIVEWTIRPIIARAFADSVPERMLAPRGSKCSRSI